MAIELVTGLPGNAKTLYTIGRIKKKAEEEQRPVFYAGIPELTLDWQEIDPVKWMECPPKSIIVIDECQRIFRNRSLGSVPPKHVTDLETHRHLGIDLVFITQHPALVDPAIRKLTQSHIHLVRVYGMEVSTVHQWDSVRDTCDKPSSRKDSNKSRWAFDKSLYSVYKSAEEHTMRRSIPLRVKLLMLAPLLLCAMAYGVYKIMSPRFEKPKATTSQVASTGSAVPAGGRTVASAAPLFDPVADAKNYVAVSTPRVVGLAHTAPKYDSLTVPVRVPVPAMCIERVANSAERELSCKCFSQQGTPMEVPFSMCRGFARDGFFQDFDAEKQGVDQAVADRAAPPPAPSSSTSGEGARIYVFDKVEDAPRVQGKPKT